MCETSKPKRQCTDPLNLQVLENVCYTARHYNTEKARCHNNPDAFEKAVPLAEFFEKDSPFE